jgi:hypothetical protein
VCFIPALKTLFVIFSGHFVLFDVESRLEPLASPDKAPKRLLLPPPEDDSSRHRKSKWFVEASGQGKLIREGQRVGRIFLTPRRPTPVPGPTTPAIRTCHAWTDGSFRQSARLGWVITEDEAGSGPTIAQGVKTLGSRQTAYDTEVEVIKAALNWYQTAGSN